MRQWSVWWAAALVACGSSAASVRGPGGAPSSSSSSGAPGPFVDRPPSPIGGTWRVGCDDSSGMTIEIAVSGKHAVGKIVDPGAARRYGYEAGEEVFRLTVDAYGDWLGETRWRGVAGTQHWDGIRFTAGTTTLQGTMTTEPCYRSLTRVGK